GRSGRGPPRGRPATRAPARGTPPPGSARHGASPVVGTPAPGPASPGRARCPPTYRHQGAGRRSLRSWLVIQAQFLGDPVDGPGQLLAQGLGAPPDLPGDRGPVVPLLPQVQALPFVGGQPAPDLFLQVTHDDRRARAIARGDEPAPLIPNGAGPAVVPAQGVLLAGLERQFVPG